jgi:hypothetical protein
VNGCPDEDAGHAAVGRMRFLAGRYAEAIPALRHASASCFAYEMSADWMHATRMLGDALAATGDARGACDAYARVLAVWGHANESRTRVEAARASARLGCSRSREEVSTRL